MKRAKTDSLAPWSQFPVSLLSVMASFLGYKDMVSLPFVCRAWRILINCSSFALHYDGDVAGKQVCEIIDMKTVRELVVKWWHIDNLNEFRGVRRLVWSMGGMTSDFDVSHLKHLDLVVKQGYFLGLADKLGRAKALQTVILRDVPLSSLNLVVDVVKALRASHEEPVSCSIHAWGEEYRLITPSAVRLVLKDLRLGCTFYATVDYEYARVFASDQELDLRYMAVHKFSFGDEGGRRWLARLSNRHDLQELLLIPSLDGSYSPPYDVEPDTTPLSIGLWTALESLTLKGRKCTNCFRDIFFGASLRALTLTDEHFAKETAAISCATLQSLTLVDFYQPLKVHASTLATLDLTFHQYDPPQVPRAWGNISLPDSAPTCRILADALNLESFHSFTQANRLAALEILVFFLSRPDQGKYAFKLPPRTLVNKSFLTTLRESALAGVQHVGTLEQCVIYTTPFYADFIASRYTAHQVYLRGLMASAYLCKLATGSFDASEGVASNEE